MKQKFSAFLLSLLAFTLLFKLTDTWLVPRFNISSFWVIAIAIGYFLGSIPFGLLLTQFFTNQDIRTIGSGNIGATNVLRTGQKKLAAITLFLDLMKGVFALFVVQYLAPNDSLAPFFTAAAAVLGHCFPLWLNFKGGKAVATAAGVLLALHPGVASVAALVWVLTLLGSRYSSLSALLACLSTPFSAYFLGSSALFYFTIFLTFLIFYRHHSNISRLLNKKETKIGKSLKEDH